MDKKSQQKQIVEKQQIMGRLDIHTLFVDSFNIGVRSDDFILLGCVQQLSDNTLVEQARIMFTKESCKQLIKNLSKAIDYYPEKPAVEEVEDKKTSSTKKASPKK